MTRLVRDNGDFLDTPWEAYTEWTWGEEEGAHAGDRVVLSGEVLHVEEGSGRAILSFGGMLGRITPPTSLRVGEGCRVTLTKREEEEANQSEGGRGSKRAR